MASHLEAIILAPSRRSSANNHGQTGPVLFTKTELVEFSSTPVPMDPDATTLGAAPSQSASLAGVSAEQFFEAIGLPSDSTTTGRITQRLTDAQVADLALSSMGM